MFNVNFIFNGHHLKVDLSSLPPGCRSIILTLPNGQQLEYTLGPDPGGPALDVPGLIAQFLIYLDINEDLRPLTLKGYRNRLGQFGEWLVRTGAGLEAGETWLAYWASLKGRGWSPYTLKGHYHILTRFGRWLFEQNFLAGDPMASIHPPKLPQDAPPKAITRAHIEQMIEAVEDDRERALLLFFRDTGCRAIEAEGLTWGNVFLEENKAHLVGKGGKHRPAFFRAPTAQALTTYRAGLKRAGPGDAVFQGHQGPLTYNGIYLVFRRVAERAGLDEDAFSPHAWRHAFGRDTTLNGIPTVQLSDLMGHSTTDVTKIYARFNTAELQQAHDRYGPDL